MHQKGMGDCTSHSDKPTPACIQWKLLQTCRLSRALAVKDQNHVKIPLSFNDLACDCLMPWSHPRINVLAGSAIVSLDGSWSCPGSASGSRINHSLHCPDGRQTTFEEAFSKHRYCLTESGTCVRTFHVAQVHIHRDISRDSEVSRWMQTWATWNVRTQVPDFVKQWRCFENASSNVVCLPSGRWSEWLIRLPDAVPGQDQDPSKETIAEAGNQEFASCFSHSHLYFYAERRPLQPMLVLVEYLALL